MNCVSENNLRAYQDGELRAAEGEKLRLILPVALSAESV